jgi:outer membrane protein assembly factor BamB
MNRVQNWLVICIVLVGGMGAASASTDDGVGDRVINALELSQAGLQTLWFGHAEVGTADQLKFAHLHVSNTRASAYFEIYVGDQLRKSFASLDRDAFGNPLGYDRAKERADFQREVIEQQVAATLAAPSLSASEYAELVFGTSPEAVQQRQKLLEDAKQKVEVRKYIEPRMSLYTLNNKNILQSFDSETGAMRWARQVGPRAGYAMGIAANDAMVAVVSGNKVYCLEGDQGRVLWSRNCSSPPNAGPAMTHSHIFVPLIDGRVEAFNIAKDGLRSDFYVSHGRTSAAPLVTGRTVSWPTDRGHYNVAYFDQIGPIKYRIQANAPIVSTPAHLGRVLFVAAMDGYVYAIDEILGSIYWEFTTGSPISQSPLAVDDAVYFVTDNEELFKVDIKTGQTPQAWPKSIPGVHRLIGAANELIYGQDPAGNLVSFRADTGARVFSFHVGDGVHLLNALTDRIFVISHQGAIQCLRQTAQVHPQFHVPVSEAVSAGQEEGKKPVRKAKQLDKEVRNPFETKEELTQDPFAASEPVHENPFVVEAAGEVNPFQLEKAAGSEKPSESDQSEAGDKKSTDEESKKPEADPEDPFSGGN